MVVVVLDEVDRLIAQDQAVLVELFLLPQVITQVTLACSRCLGEDVFPGMASCVHLVEFAVSGGSLQVWQGNQMHRLGR